MNILEIAKECGCSSMNFGVQNEEAYTYTFQKWMLEAFAAAVVEDYKASLVPHCWMIKYENGEWGPSQTKSLEYESIPLYALPKGTT